MDALEIILGAPEGGQRRAIASGRWRRQGVAFSRQREAQRSLARGDASWCFWSTTTHILSFQISIDGALAQGWCKPLRH